jgi:hypothetical protein
MYLKLDGLTTLSDIAAKYLSEYGGSIIELHGLTTLSDVAAEYLSKCKCEIYMSGLTSLSDKAAESLSHQRYPRGMALQPKIQAQLDKFRMKK